MGLTLRRCLRGAVAVWRVARKTARMPDLAIFSTRDSKVLLRLGEKLFEAYIKGDKIMEIYQVLRARIVRDRPWRHNQPVAWAHFRLKCSMCGFQVSSSSIQTPRYLETLVTERTMSLHLTTHGVRSRPRGLSSITCVFDEFRRRPISVNHSSRQVKAVVRREQTTAGSGSEVSITMSSANSWFLTRGGKMEETSLM